MSPQNLQRRIIFCCILCGSCWEFFKMKHLYPTALLTLFTLTAPLTAQVATGSIAGSVVDATSAGIPGAKVTAKNVRSGVEVVAMASDAGLYVFAALPPAVYDLTFEKTGFKKTLRTGVEVRIAQRIDLNVQLELGDVTQSVEVAADVPVLETSTAERGTNFSLKFMDNLPLFSGGIRNPRSFITLMPGVTTGAGELSVSGSGGRGQEILIDGASATIPESGGTIFNMPSAEMFQEFKLVQSTFAAEYGRFGGGVELFTTRSGGAWWHGAAFLNLRRQIWNANTWANNSRGIERPKERFSEVGGSIGGPVWIPKVYNADRNKTFFFFTYTKDLRPASILGTPVNTVPTQAMKQGNFSGTGLPLIYDPATTAGGTRSPFPNNQIPQSRMSQVARNILPFIPDPTRPTLAANYDFVSSRVYDRTIWSIKADHNFSSTHRVSYFLSRDNEVFTDVNNFQGPLGHGLENSQKPYNHRVNHDLSISPSLFMHTTFGFSAQRQGWDNPFQRGFASQIGIPGIPSVGDAFPRVLWRGRAGLTAWGVQDGKVASGGQNNDTWMVTQGYSWIRGKHEIKFGWDARWLSTIGFDYAGTNGRFFFNSNQTALPGSLTTTGHEFASFLLGAADEADRIVPPVLFDPIRYRYVAGYIQDNWRIRPKLTLNFGIRYEVPIGWHVPAGYTYLDTSMPNPAAGNLPGALRFAGVGAGRSGVARNFPTDFSNVGPRGGFAWQISSKTVMRGGFGIYYQTLGNGGCGCREGFAGVPSNFLSDGLNPALNWDGGIPVSPTWAPPPNLNPALLNFQNASVMGDTFGRAPRIYNWSFELQHDFKGFLLSAAYQGNRGRGLASSVDLNQLPFSRLSLGSLLQQSVNSSQAAAAGITAPFAGFGNRTVSQALRPFPQYLNVFSRNAAAGRSWYDAFQFKAEKRYGGWQMLMNYTYSKSLGYAHFRQIFTQVGAATPEDYYNIPNSKSYMPFDQPHIMNIINAYDLPWGKGRKWLANSNALVNAVAGGWTISMVNRYTSGNLIRIETPGNPLGPGVLFTQVTRANLTGQAIQTGIDRKELDPNNPSARWFNPAAFSTPAAFTPGTAAFFHSQFRQPPVLTENMSLVKRTILWENERNPVTLIVRADAFNAFNRTSFGGAVGTIGNVNFGRVTGPQVGARLITGGLRLEF